MRASPAAVPGPARRRGRALPGEIGRGAAARSAGAPARASFRRLVPLVVAALVWRQGPAAEIVACIVADTPDNSSYYGMATTVTRLRCEFINTDYYPTLPELYRQGWRLIQVLGGDQALSQGTRGPSPLYLLEREGPAPSADSAAARPGPAASSTGPAPRAAGSQPPSDPRRSQP